MISKVDSRIHDSVALEEIELYGDLMIAASQSTRTLTRVEIDEVLGVTPQGPQAPGRSHERQGSTRAAAQPTTS